MGISLRGLARTQSTIISKQIILSFSVDSLASFKGGQRLSPYFHEKHAFLLLI